MSPFVQNMLSQNSVSAAYLLAALVLNGLVLFALWRGRQTMSRTVTTPLYAAVFTFILSRLLLLRTGFLTMPREIEMLLFSGLNFVGYGCLVVSLVRMVAMARADDATRRVFPSLEILGIQTLTFGTLASLIYFVRSFGAFGLEFAAGLLAMGLLGATVRLVAFIYQRMFAEFNGRNPGTLVPLTFLAISWVAVGVSPFLPTTVAATVLNAARVLDIGALVVVLGGFMSRQMFMASTLKVAASEATEEMNVAKAELAKLNSVTTNLYEDSSELIKKQKEQTLLYMKKADSLERILQIGVNIQKLQHLDDVLAMIVETIRDNLGFKTVVLRLLNKKAQNFETHAHIGLKDEVRDSIVNYRIPITEYQKMVDPRFRLSKSYFIRTHNPWYGKDLTTARSVLVDDSWREIDMLIVPLLTEDQATIGYLSVENPEIQRSRLGTS